MPGVVTQSLDSSSGTQVLNHSLVKMSRAGVSVPGCSRIPNIKSRVLAGKLYSSYRSSGRLWCSLAYRRSLCFALLAFVTGKYLSVKAPRVVAGQEPEKTNEFLQVLAEAIEMKVCLYLKAYCLFICHVTACQEM